MTRLVALELFGFKSFADRTRFEFPDGVTAVVGPNGSGKSNVVDAIKWVLGEQSVRSLRGKEMTDVIFSGSAGRKPLNAAEVSLVFDNSARDLPVESDEVRITRRVYRDGESEYLVNGEAARLRDFRELFSGTGAATEAYSVIEQGRVDALLVASGRDRRAVFEEAAGITRFRVRRAEALRRLERAEQNRQRLADIVGEVTARLETVRHQATRANRWKQMQSRLRSLRIVAAGRDLLGVDARLAAADEALATTREEGRRWERVIEQTAAEVHALDDLAVTLLPRLTSARAAATTAAQRAAAATAAWSLKRSRLPDVEAERGRLEAVVGTAVDAGRRTAAVAATAETEAATLATTLADIATRLQECDAAAAGAHGHAGTLRSQLAAATTAIDELTRRRLQLESVSDRATSRADDARRAAERSRDAVDAARLRAARLAESRAACEGNVSSLASRMAAATRDLEQLEAAQRETGVALQAAWKELAAATAAAEACRERCGLVRELVVRHEGLSEAARRLLAAGPPVPGFVGVLADRLVSDVEWADLVDVALGDLGQALVVAALDETVAWHASWCGGEASRSIMEAGGRISFLDPARLAEPGAFEPPPRPGLVGRLDRLIAAAGPAREESEALLARRLLGRVWVVERIEHALALIDDAPSGILFLARDGSCLRAGGGLDVGSPAATGGLVARRSELRVLAEREVELIRAADRSRSHVETLEADLAAGAAAIQQATQRRQQFVETTAASRSELDRILRDERLAADAVVAAEREARSAEQLAATKADDAVRARSELTATDPALASATAEADRCRAAIDALERDRGEVLDEIQRLRVEQAACRERLAHCRDAAAAAAAAHEESRAAVTTARQAAHDARIRVATHELEILAASAAHAEAAWAEERCLALLAALGTEADGLESRRREVSSAIDAARAAASRAGEQLHGLELEVGEARHQRARIVERIRDEYDIDIDEESAAETAPPDDVPADRDELEQAIEDVRRRLASMTTVNLEALAESEQLAERLGVLESQLADVTGAKESIEKLIARIDEESRKLLGDTIETVRGHFRDLFERVFGGGQADIVLEPGVDLLETAVDIVARPPGKEPRNISLLSGGEKTMTCVALLLAIFRSRPSPFCVLDEVDAALDEANVDRFVGVLRDFLSSTQFIVVTHSKKTMAAATTLYGVTMEESGVSKRVSVRFEATAAAARTASRAA